MHHFARCLTPGWSRRPLGGNLTSGQRRVAKELASLALLLATTCDWGTSAKMLSDVRPAPTCTEGVTVFPKASAIGKQFIYIADLKTATSADCGPYGAQLLKDQKQKAAELGANGLIRNKGEPWKAQAVYVPDDTTGAARVCAKLHAPT
jgi:hypothetical protein